MDAARLSAQALRILPRKGISASMGRLASLRAGPLARAAIASFIRAYDVDLSEAIVPRGGYRSFDEFFTRKLKDGARPVDPDLDAIISPADGRIEDFGPVDENASFLVKGQEYSAPELLGSERAKRYAGGNYFIVYLSPRDYHRVHAPVGGPVERLTYVPGTLYPVNRIGLEHVPRLFARNERMVIEQASAEFDSVTTIMVGAIVVGRISLTFDDVQSNVGDEPGEREYGEDGPPIGRGEELGKFHLGSTAIVFVGPEHPLRFLIHPGDHVRVGQAIARRHP